MDGSSFSRVKRYLMVIARGLFVAGTVFALTLLTGTYIINRLLPPVYRATAEIEIKPRMNADASPAEVVTLDSIQANAELGIIASPEILLPVVRDLQMDKFWGRRNFGTTQAPLSENGAVAHLQNILRLDLKRGTNIVDITVWSDLPKEAAALANAIAERYRLQRDMDEKDLADHVKGGINNEIDQQQELISDKEAVLEKIREGLEQKGIAINPEASGPEAGTLQPYRAAQRDLDRQRALLDALVLHLRRVIDNYQLAESPVLLLTRAEPPLASARPNHHFDVILTFVVAAFLGVSIASSVEVLFLLSRASERPESN